MEKKTFFCIARLKLVCCSAIIIIILGGMGLISGVGKRNIVLLSLGFGMLIHGLYARIKGEAKDGAFGRHGRGVSIKT